ncbi:hypothetical protein ACKKBG_A32475 [Auxenochlorella protothecoides x Auxenochlorella symbiontica]
MYSMHAIVASAQCARGPATPTMCIAPRQGPQTNAHSLSHWTPRPPKHSFPHLRHESLYIASCTVEKRATRTPAWTLPAPCSDAILAGSTLYTVMIVALMLKAVLRREHTSFSLSLKAYVPLALLYGYTLALSWRPDLLGTLLPGSLAAGFQGGWNPQFFPRLEGIMAIFSRPDTALSVWLHVLATSLFSAQNLCRQVLVQPPAPGVNPPS